MAMARPWYGYGIELVPRLGTGDKNHHCTIPVIKSQPCSLKQGYFPRTRPLFEEIINVLFLGVVENPAYAGSTVEKESACGSIFGASFCGSFCVELVAALCVAVPNITHVWFLEMPVCVIPPSRI